MKIMVKNRIILLLISFMSSLTLPKSAVYLQNYCSNHSLRISNLIKDDKDTSIEIPAGTEIPPFVLGEKNRVLLFKLGRGAGSSEDYTEATVEAGITNANSEETSWVSLFTLKQKIEHRFLHSNMYASLSTSKFNTNLQEVNPNQPIIRVEKVAGTQFVIVLKKIDVKNGDDNYVYQVFDIPKE